LPFHSFVLPLYSYFDTTDAWWSRLVAEGEAKLVRPEVFHKPHVRAWLSNPAVGRMLKDLARARTIGAAESPTDFESLVASHMAESLEDRQHAESAVAVAIAFLRASLQAAVNDPGTAGVVQALSGEQQRRFNAVDEKLERLAAESSRTDKPDGPTLLRSLSIPKRTWDQETSPPAALLRAEFGVVPFTGRVAELDRLHAWAAQPASVAIALVTGSGGRGKTRLAIEAATRAGADGWRAGFVDEGLLMPLLEAAASDDRLLLVVDYAEDEPTHLIDALQTAGELARDAQRRLRILLLARNAGDWWERVQSSGGPATDLTHHPSTFLRMRLGELAGDEAQAVPLLNLARAAFRAELKASAAEPASDVAPCSREALLIFAQALLLELGEAGSIPADEAVLGYMLSRERGFWHRALARHGLDEPHWRLFEVLVTVVTLAGGAHNIQELDRLLKAFTAHFALDVRTTETLRIVLLAVYGVGDRVEPLQPDRLGESLIATHAQPEVLALASFREGL
jgi:hypothetical protein